MQLILLQHHEIDNGVEILSSQNICYFFIIFVTMYVINDDSLTH